MSNDWSKKTLKERISNAEEHILGYLPEDCWSQILGNMSKKAFREERCGSQFICMTSYVDGVGVLMKFNMGNSDIDDVVAYHALFVQGKGLYLPKHMTGHAGLWAKYRVGEELYFSETQNRKYQKQNLKDDIAKYTVIETQALSDFLEASGYKTLTEFIEREALSITKQNPKTQKALDIMDNLKPITKEMLSEYYPHVWNVQYNYNDNKIHYACSCGKEFYCDEDSVEAISCTGDDLSTYSGRNEGYKRSTGEKIFLEYNPEYKVFIWRQACLKQAANYKNWEEITTEFSVPHTIILGEKFLCIMNDKRESVSATEIDDLFSKWGITSSKIVKLNDVDSYYEKSFLKYSGAKEIWVKTPSETWSLARNGYLYSWLKTPCIEQLSKAGFLDLAQDIMYNNTFAKEVLNLKKTKATDIIGLPKPFYNFAKEEKLLLKGIRNLKQIVNSFPDVSVEDTKMLMSCNGGLSETEVNMMLEVSKYGISFKQIAKYIKEVEETQFIFGLGVILSYWRDSLKMAKDLDMRFRKDVKYPKSLKLNHDKLTFYTNQLAKVIETKHFYEAVNDALQYEYTGDKYKDGTEDKFFISIPKTPQELIDEGDAQCHCVASYLDLVSNKTCIIAFLRRKEEPDESYFTIEIRKNKVMQLKGSSNTRCEDTETLKFVKKWMKNKKLKKSTNDF